MRRPPDVLHGNGEVHAFTAGKHSEDGSMTAARYEQARNHRCHPKEEHVIRKLMLAFGATAVALTIALPAWAAKPAKPATTSAHALCMQAIADANKTFVAQQRDAVKKLHADQKAAKKALRVAQKAARKALHDQQAADRATFHTQHPNATEAELAAFHAQQEAATKALNDKQKADRKALHAQQEAAKKALHDQQKADRAAFNAKQKAAKDACPKS
jgi:hypothetical protein